MIARLAVAALLLAGCGDNPARAAIDAQRAAAPASTSGWSCPMHPEVHADGPGPCPVCGMPLVESGS